MSTPASTSTLLSPRDLEKLAALKRMKRLATALLIVMAAIFVVAFALQERYPWLAYVRAAAEGGMVGAIADWFAVTALFRYPLGLRIPHTAIIPTRKDEIGRTLGEFVESNFLSQEVVRSKLRSVGISRALGTWLSDEANAHRLVGEVSAAARGALSLLSDDDMRGVIESIARRQITEPEWGPPLGRVTARIVEAGHQESVVDLLIDGLGEWIAANPQALDKVVSGRLPRWLPSIVDRVVDDRALRELQKFLVAVREDPDHLLRKAIDEYLTTLADDLQSDPVMIAKVEDLKERAFSSPQIRELATRAWDAARSALLTALEDPASELRLRMEQIVADFGATLLSDPELGAKVDVWVEDAAGYLVETYRHEIAAVISETVAGWDADETSRKLEVEVGRDLQFIRINGTVVGSLAGLTIFTIAHAIFG